MNVSLKLIRILILLLCVLFGIASCRRPIATMDSGFKSTKAYELILSFDPATILNDIANGTVDFTLLEESRFGEEPGGDPSYWSQAEYYTILSRAFEFAWQEDPLDFRISVVDLETSCQNMDKGFSWAYFQFYRLSENVSVRAYRSVLIQPTYSEISLVSAEHYPSGRGYFVDSYIEPGALTAEEALAIAEKAGGIDYRNRVGNRCMLDVVFTSNRKFDGWRIAYDGGGNPPVLTIIVNEQSGAYEIIQE